MAKQKSISRSRTGDKGSKTEASYLLSEQIGFLIRQAMQRHTSIFAKLMSPDLTPTRFAALAKLHEVGSLSQNQLGRQTSMDIATIKGVVDRLRDRGLVVRDQDPNDRRRQIVSLTKKGAKSIANAIPIAVAVTEKTLDPLTAAETKKLISLFKKIS